MATQGIAGFKGHLGTKVMRRHPKGLAKVARRVSNAWWALTLGVPVIKVELHARHYIAAENRWEDVGLLGRHLVVDAFIDDMTALLAAGVLGNFNDFKFHDSGVGTTAENAGDTAIETTDAESRDTGTQVNVGSGVYRSVGTIAYSSTKAITEHGLFDEVTAGGLLDRTVFAAINVVSGDSIQFTYSLTISGS